MKNQTLPFSGYISLVQDRLCFWAIAFGIILCGISACSNPDTNELTDHSVKEDFVISSWWSLPGDFDSLEVINKLAYFDSLGISELLVGGGVRTLERLLPLAKAKGIKIHAWMWTLNRPNDSIAMQNPDWYAVNREGKHSLEYRAYVNYYQWLSPFHPEAREHVKSKVKELMQVEGLASIHLDYVRYVDVILGKALQPKYGLVQESEMPEYDYGYHPIARDSFKSIFGLDPMEMEHPELSNEWRQFRLNAVTSLVNEISDMVHASGHQLSAAVFPFPEMSRKMVRQDWSSWKLDRAYPMLYQNFYEQNVEWIGFGLEQGLREADFPIYAGLYMPALKEATDLKKAIDLCKEKGAAGVSLFTANNLNSVQRDALIEFN